MTSWTEARISWPCCRALDSGRGGSGILVDEELARAIRCESAVALHYWWGASVNTIARWRRALGVARADSGGSRRLIQAASQAGAEAIRGKPLPLAQIERRRKTAKALKLKQYLRPGYQGPCWSISELQFDALWANDGTPNGPVSQTPPQRRRLTSADKWS